MPDPEDDKPEDDKPDPDPDKGKDLQAEVEKWKSLSRKHEADAKRNAEAAKKLADLESQQQTEAERLAAAHKAAEERAVKAERDLLRERVARKKGLSEALVRRLSGETEEELEADADELLEAFKPQKDDSDKNRPERPRERLRPGAEPKAEPEETDPNKLAAAVPRG